MDCYCYYKERFIWGANPYISVAQCQQIVTEMLDNPRIPFKIAAESSVGFLAALADFAGNGCTVTMGYTTVMNALIDYLHRMRDVTDARDKAWCREMMEAEQEAGGAPVYDPGDYEVWPVDLEGEDEETDGEPESDEPAPTDIAELYGSVGEVGSTGTRRPWPDWQHCANWTSGDWVRFQIYKEKILAAAKLHDFFAMGTVTNTIAAASAHMSLLPVPRQAEIALWCKQLADELCTHMEANLQELCAGTLYTPDGRTTQKVSLE